MADGNVVPCTQIPNNEIVLGIVKEKSLEEIWNGEEYKNFRQMHISGNFPKNHKCYARCDQIKLFEYLKKYHGLMFSQNFIKELPSLESITRQRRKLAERYELFRPDKKEVIESRLNQT